MAAVLLTTMLPGCAWLSGGNAAAYRADNINALRPGEPVEDQLYSKSDFEPRGEFSFVPKDYRNLLLLRRGGSGSSAR